MRPVIWGSSPLARGLRLGPGGAAQDDRIIPARAGFTCAHCCERYREPDHPRSRGVYQGRYSFFGGQPGIIPARAGFTPTCGLLRGRTRDHPRSRGVYPDTDMWAAIADGSSPLARGLLREWLLRRRRARIIPARAGFTHGPEETLQPRGDHPRSRGVYPAYYLRDVCQPGSSPLARGLPKRGVVKDLFMGIIPARAGFTKCALTLKFCVGDHPRSRGVYRRTPHRAGERDGSSPLARGLQLLQRGESQSRRIIPARAGFTVFFSIALGPIGGSSPLARGLLRRGVRGRLCLRIIPARAGFTGRRTG